MDVPEDKKGRALVKLDEIDMMQLYTPVPCLDELTYIEKLKEFVSTLAKKSTEKKAKGIPVLPEELHFSQLSEYPGYEEMVGEDTINEGLEGTAGEGEAIANNGELQESLAVPVTQIPIGIETEQLNVVGLDISKEPALIIGESGMGRTNVVKCTLEFITKHVKETQIFIFDTTSMNLRNYSNLDNIKYATGKEQSVLLMEKLKELIENRKVTFEAQRESNLLMSIKEYGLKQTPVFVVIDIVQELYENLDGDKEKLDILKEALDVGIFVIASADNKLRTRMSEFLETLTSVKNAVVVGNYREQNLFSTVGFRENNTDPRFGYMYSKGKIKKVMIPLV